MSTTPAGRDFAAKDSAESPGGHLLPHDPAAEYQRRLKELRATEARFKTHDDRLAYAIFALIVAAVILGFLLLVPKTYSFYWICLPFGLFVIFALIHTRVLRTLRNCRRAIAFYKRGLARIENRWIGRGQNGERFLDPAHPYARDLDIFGNGSLFELLCTARTRAGEQTLAAWLLAPASPDEVIVRQGAVGDMRGRVSFREDLAVLSEGIDAAGHTEALTAWGEGKATFGPAPYLRLGFLVLTLLSVSSFVLWAVGGLWYVPALFFALDFVISVVLRKRAAVSVSAIDAAVREVQVIADVLARVESETFSSAKLTALQGQLRKGDQSASRCTARLAKLGQGFESRRSYLLALIDWFVFWTLQYTLAIEAWRRQFGPEVRTWLSALGEMEALSDLAGYSYEHPADVFPDFTADSPCFQAEGLAHPLMAEKTAVRNDLALGKDLRVVIISGPNMAGKSTFVRAAGVNAVLAQCGAPVRAAKMRISPLAVAACVCVLDSLQGGISRFYAEITRLRLIMEMAQGPVPVLFLLDELLSGTNSHDRRVGAEAIVHGLLKRNAVGLITTHDLSLAEIAKVLCDRAANVHFEDHLENGKLRFDYRLTPGVVQTSNALDLMRSIGLDV